ncbi:MAG: adenine deaminase [Spirochaetes bacterium]|nr:adenine deaminase [Spirochaetota bacterium]
MFPYNADNRNLVETALGNKPADLVIRNGSLIDVYTGRVLEKRSVAVSGRWISYAGPDADYAIGKGTRVIEAEGHVISPGFVDGHTHVTSFFDIADLLMYSIPGGTTTFITEVDSYGFGLGAQGFRIFLDQVKDRPVKFFCTVPALVSASPASAHHAIKPEEIRELLKMEEVLGMGESYWQNAILTEDNRVLELMQETIKAGKSVQGHAAGAADRRLGAYACAGAVSCHEAVSPEDILNRLEMGYWTFLRQGYIREDVEALKPLIGSISLRKCILCTDGIDAEFLLQRGYFNDVIQNAINMGIPPVEAIQMSSLNCAELYHMDHLIGGIAPGRYADICILPSLDVIKPDVVISNGRIIYENGAVSAGLERIPYKKQIYMTVNVPPVKPEDFIVAADKCSKPGMVRTIDIQSNGLVAKEGSAKAPVADGKAAADPENDLLKAVFIDRATGKAEMFTGFVRGMGMRAGAAATTQAWDASAIVAVGANDEDLALAVNKVIAHQGGTVIAVGGKVAVDLPFPIAGYVSDAPVEEVTAGMISFQKKFEELGSKLRSAHLTLVVLTSAAIPFIRITEKGYFRFRENDYVGI